MTELLIYHQRQEYIDIIFMFAIVNSLISTQVYEDVSIIFEANYYPIFDDCKKNEIEEYILKSKKKFGEMIRKNNKEKVMLILNSFFEERKGIEFFLKQTNDKIEMYGIKFNELKEEIRKKYNKLKYSLL